MKSADVLDKLDVIDRIEGVISTFINADWFGAYDRAGAYGLVSEFLECLTAHNAPIICVSRQSSWSGVKVERLLKRYGVKVWNRGLVGDDLYFRVKRRQVEWAEYLLLRAGVPVTSALVEPRNREYTDGYAPGSEPRRQQSSPQSRGFFW